MRRLLASVRVMPKRFVLRAQERRRPPRYYTGLTTDMTRRLAEHNAGSCTHSQRSTVRGPSIVVIEFSDERRAVALERYLKSGSGVGLREIGICDSSARLRTPLK
jgi:predicted GIY-YIG superfamily endonuclease